MKGFPIMFKFNMNGFLNTETIVLHLVIPSVNVSGYITIITFSRRLLRNKKKKKNVHKGEASDTMKHPIPQQARQHEVELSNAIVQQ